MKFRRKKKDSSIDETDESALVEVANAPVEFITMQELLAKAGVVSPDEEDGSDPELDESPKWEVQIDGMIPMEAGGTRFSAFTAGENSSGQMVVEFKSKAGVNSAIFAWLQKPLEKRVRMTVRDHEESRIEQWNMSAVPVAIAVDDLDRNEKDPWFTTLQMSVKDIKIT